MEHRKLKLHMKSHLKVIMNINNFIGNSLSDLQFELKRTPVDSSTVNTIIFMVLTETQGLLSSVLSFSQYSGGSNIIGNLCEEVNAKTYQGMTFSNFVTATIHSYPCLGPVKSKGYVRDIYDENKIGIFNDFLLPVYEKIDLVIKRLVFLS